MASSTSTTTSTTTLIHDAQGNSFMLPGMRSPELGHHDACGRSVRFDSECILIPDTPRKQRLVSTRSYSLALWKKKNSNTNSESDEDSTPAATATTSTHQRSHSHSHGHRSRSPEDNRVVIKVPIPMFRRRSSRSPTRRGRSISASPVIPKALPSCLVHRSPSITTTQPPLAGLSMLPTNHPSPNTTPHTHTHSISLNPIRRNSITSSSTNSSSQGHSGTTPTTPTSQRRKDKHKDKDRDDLTIIPLRDCCQACERITEECLKEGDSWQERFSRGARRRRSASLDHHDATSLRLSGGRGVGAGLGHMRTGSLSISSGSGSGSGMGGATQGIMGGGVGTVGASDGVEDDLFDTTTTSAFRLTVDEVDKRRKSLDMSAAALNTDPSSSTSPAETMTGVGLFSSPTGPLCLTTAPRYPSSAPVSHRTTRRYSPPTSSNDTFGSSFDREASWTSTTSSNSTSPSINTSSTSSSSAEGGEQYLIPADRDAAFLSHQHYLSSSPIQEEDEAQLFPLPSPRRSPSASGSSTRSGRSGTPSPRISPVPSPNGSVTFLPAPGIVGGSNGSGAVGGTGNTSGGAGGGGTSQESLLKASLSRKGGSGAVAMSRDGYLAASNAISAPSTTTTTIFGTSSVSGGSSLSKKTPISPPPSRLSIPTSTPQTSSASSSSSIPAPASASPSLIKNNENHGASSPGSGRNTPTESPKGPRERTSHSRASSLRVITTPASPVAANNGASGLANGATAPRTSPTKSKSFLALGPLRNNSSSSSSSPAPGTNANTNTTGLTSFPSPNLTSASSPRSPTSPSFSPRSPVSPGGSGSGGGKRKHSFTAPFIKAGGALRDVGVDVLKGVSSISGAGGVGM